MNKKVKKLEAILWSIALPGFAQILNGKFIKGASFVLLEIIINVISRFNLAIMYSFQGFIYEAIDVIDFQWLMFYPCLYMFSMWDAYRDAEGETGPYSYLPFAFGAYLVTVGLMYSTQLRIFGVLPGPVFLPMLFLIPGLAIGFLIRSVLLRLASS
ncbi:hypothetical protein [Evansella clarkii]|jgi:hypothetical protein|uniref:hypothetical protein n=1 Tax=Evansella clarkii TaxID=79879 RepID=UPI0009987D2C|nr:hypothetical protein [Evansella clarkii]